MKNRTGFELPVGILATYFIFKLWWAGWFQSMGIELLAPQMPQLLTADGSQVLTADQVYGNSVFGTLFIEAINLLVGVGTLVIWIVTGLWAVLKDLVFGLSQGMGTVRGLEWPTLDFWKKKTPEVKPEKQPTAEGEIAAEEAKRVIVANELVSAALDGSQSRLIAAAEMLHGKQFIRRAEPAPVEPPAVEAAAPKATRRRTTASKK